MAQNYHYLFIAISCAKMSSVYKPLGNQVVEICVWMQCLIRC
jgi:hypothetical protein